MERVDNVENGNKGLSASGVLPVIELDENFVHALHIPPRYVSHLSPVFACFVNRLASVVNKKWVSRVLLITQSGEMILFDPADGRITHNASLRYRKSRGTEGRGAAPQRLVHIVVEQSVPPNPLETRTTLWIQTCVNDTFFAAILRFPTPFQEDPLALVNVILHFVPECHVLVHQHTTGNLSNYIPQNLHSVPSGQAVDGGSCAPGSSTCGETKRYVLQFTLEERRRKREERDRREVKERMNEAKREEEEEKRVEAEPITAMDFAPPLAEYLSGAIAHPVPLHEDFQLEWVAFRSSVNNNDVNTRSDELIDSRPLAQLQTKEEVESHLSDDSRSNVWPVVQTVVVTGNEMMNDWGKDKEKDEPAAEECNKGGKNNMLDESHVSNHNKREIFRSKRKTEEDNGDVDTKVDNLSNNSRDFGSHNGNSSNSEGDIGHVVKGGGPATPSPSPKKPPGLRAMAIYAESEAEVKAMQDHLLEEIEDQNEDTAFIPYKGDECNVNHVSLSLSPPMSLYINNDVKAKISSPLLSRHSDPQPAADKSFGFLNSNVAHGYTLEDALRANGDHILSVHPLRRSLVDHRSRSNHVPDDERQWWVAYQSNVGRKSAPRDCKAVEEIHVFVSTSPDHS